MAIKYKYAVALPELSGNEEAYLKECIETGWVSSTGPFIERFEEAFADYIGTKHAVACSSGTTALTLALAALDIGPGDEVIVPEFTMVATAWAVHYVGATPVFVDCGSDLNIDTVALAKAITSRTKAIIPVHIYGRVANMARVRQLIKGREIHVIEDAAEAHGARQGNKYAGAIGDMGCFSFFGNKILTSGEGGVITTDDAGTAARLRYLRSMAFEPNHTFLHQDLGYNFRMTNMQAAVALAQLERIEEFLHKRRQITAWYDKYIGEFTISRPEGSVTWMYDVVVDANSRDDMMMQLGNVGIETRMFFKPMSMQPMFLGKYMTLNAYAYSQAGFYLPAYTQLNEKDVDHICQKFLQCLPSKR